MLRRLTILFFLCCACERRPEAWAADLSSRDPFDRFLASVALAQGDGPVPTRVFGELVRFTQDPDRRMRATAVRVLQEKPDEAAQAYLALLGGSGSPGEEGVTWTGSEFERGLLERIAPAVKHPQCARHTRFCRFVAKLPEGTRRDLIRWSEERPPARAADDR